MKKITSLLAVMFITTMLFAQADSTKVKTSFYTSIGFSIGHVDPSNPAIDNFNKSSYPSVEFGFTRRSVGLGIVFGTENMLTSSGSRGYYELKTSLSKPVGECSAYALFGVGSYFEKSFSPFIEYGAGFSYMPNKIGYFVQYSNWATTNYISAGFTYCF